MYPSTVIGAKEGALKHHRCKTPDKETQPLITAGWCFYRSFKMLKVQKQPQSMFFSEGFAPNQELNLMFCHERTDLN